MNILVLHGPNLNLLGTREPDVYGSVTLADINAHLLDFAAAHGATLRILQSNHEGDLIDALHEARSWAHGVIINPGGYTHTSVALRDAVKLLQVPFVEIHISNVYKREPFRQHSYLSDLAEGVIAGLGVMGYELAALFALDYLAKPK